MNKISKEIFEIEINMCKKLFQDEGKKCNWGECDKCGVVPLLYKLFKGKLLETDSEIDELKSKILGKI